VIVPSDTEVGQVELQICFQGVNLAKGLDESHEAPSSSALLGLAPA
jgi:hypothetical protein